MSGEFKGIAITTTGRVRSLWYRLPEHSTHPPMVRDGDPTVDPSPSRLVDRIRSAARLRHLSRRTENAYIGWIRRFVLFNDKIHPRSQATTVALRGSARAVYPHNPRPVPHPKPVRRGAFAALPGVADSR